MDAMELLDKHRDALAERLRDVTAQNVQGNVELSEWLSTVLDDEEKVELMPPRRPVLPGEDVFWWCVEQLLLLGDIVLPATDPYLQMIVQDLNAFAERVANREPLPPGYQVGWLDFDQAEAG